ncbi:MAG: serine--tRNA ligase [Candidatus Saccharimonadales bacterium]
MLDIRFIRENPELIAEKSKQKGYKVNITKLLGVDDNRRKVSAEIERVRAERNQLADQTKGAKPDASSVEQGKKLKDSLAQLEAQLKPVEEEYLNLLKSVPNMPADDVPVGASEADNVVAKEWGEKPKFNFEPKTHWQIAEERNLVDKARAAKVSGSRFAYIKGDLVRLQFGLIQLVTDTLTNEETLKKVIQEMGLKEISSKPFTPVLPPLMIKTAVFDAMDRLEPRDDRYKIGSDKDDLWLQGSAEHVLGPMYMDETLEPGAFPIRLLGYATSFRREAGSYGKDTEGIIRMHQFDKLEMESFTKPEDGLKEHLFFIAIQEYLLQQLNLPYHVLNKCTADIGKPNARGVDLEVWLPGHNRYLETHTADYMTDYQARGLQTRIRGAEFVYTNDATALAMGRTMVAIIENYQQADGKVGIPEVLRPYMHNQTSL